MQKLPFYFYFLSLELYVCLPLIQLQILLNCTFQSWVFCQFHPPPLPSPKFYFPDCLNQTRSASSTRSPRWQGALCQASSRGVCDPGPSSSLTPLRLLQTWSSATSLPLCPSCSCETLGTTKEQFAK